MYRNDVMAYFQPKDWAFVCFINVPVIFISPLTSLQDLQEFVDGSGDNGFIVFTLGSVVSNMPMEKAKLFLDAFGQIPQRVTIIIWLLCILILWLATQQNNHYHTNHSAHTVR